MKVFSPEMLFNINVHRHAVTEIYIDVAVE